MALPASGTLTTLQPLAGSSLAKKALIVAGGTAFLIALSKVAVGFPVPMTLGTLAVMIIALTFGMRMGVATIIAYLALGAAGVPVFAKPDAFGIAYMLGGTGGFLAGYLACVAIVGFLADQGFTRSWAGTIVALVLGSVVLFALGVAWLTYLYGFESAIKFGVTPFVISEPVKIALAALIGKGVLKGASRFTSL